MGFVFDVIWSRIAAKEIPFRKNGFVAPSGACGFWALVPTARAVGYYLSPLCGWPPRTPSATQALENSNARRQSRVLRSGGRQCWSHLVPVLNVLVAELAGSLKVGAADGFGGRLIRTVSFFN